jgi:LysR family transcriptional regulator, hydrogen peroxide-inducible genes activator
MQRSIISTALSAVSLRDLALVQAVAREGSFTAAARLMNISASGLSHQVQKVEQALGITVFERGGRGVALAGGGARVIALINDVLASAERLQAGALAGSIAFGGELRLGVPATLGPYLLPQLIEPFPRHFGEARLTISEGKPRGLLRRLAEGELDAVLASPGTAMPGLSSRRLFFEPYELLVHADHPVAGMASVSLAALDPAQATLMAESHAGAHGSDRIQDVSLESLATLVAVRGGYTFVPVLAHDRLASIPNVSLVAVEGEAPGREVALYWRSATAWGDDLVSLGDLLVDLAGRMPGLTPVVEGGTGQ